jgi:hypothetical protein
MVPRRTFVTTAVGTGLALAGRPADLLAEAELADGLPSSAAKAARLSALPASKP